MTCLQVCWIIISPLLLVVILVAALIDWTQPSYGPLPYPDWAHGVGWTLTLISVLQIPFWFLLTIILHYSKLSTWFTSSPLCCTQAWVDRRDLTNEMVTNISILDRRDRCNQSMMGKVSIIDTKDWIRNSSDTKKQNMTTSTTTTSKSSINSYMGTTQPEPGKERDICI